jgi:hypothetical protein
MNGDLLQNAMEVMCMIAVLVNCALIGLSGQVHRMFPEMSTTQTILLIVALEVRHTKFASLGELAVCIISVTPKLLGEQSL